jgi:hypothetical protein
MIGALVAGTAANALAAEGKQGTIEKSKGDSSSAGGRSDTGGGGSSGDVIIREDRRLLVDQKPWEVEAAVEGHHLWRQNDLSGAAQDKNLLFYSFLGRYQFTKFDQVQAYFGFYERFLADPNETGLRLDDMFLSYWRLIPLPEEVELRLNARVGIPTSFLSQKASLIAAPSIGARITRVFIEDLVVNLRVRGTYNWYKYSTAEGGNANQSFSFSVSADAEYQMPFYHPLSAGAELYNAYHWYYGIPNQGPALGSNPGFANNMFPGAIQDPTFGTAQPIQQTYGGDIFVRYTFPEWNGLRTDFEVAVAEGDPTLGYDNRLHDGASHVYLGFRRSAEVFGVFTAVY